MGEAATDQRSLAASLAPALRELTDGRLGEPRWFRADWQRAGAATATVPWRDDNGNEVEAILKLPVTGRELKWTRRLAPEPTEDDAVVPRLYASGERIGGYDLRWVVIERLPVGPLGLRWDDHHVSRMADALARFADRANRHPVDVPPLREDWPAMVADSVQRVRENHLPEERRWRAALKQLKRRLNDLVTEWRARPVDEWQHGDAHLANAMCRSDGPDDPVTLIDLAEVHAGHWVEDAVYLERQLWGRPERLETRPVKAVAAARRAAGLPVGENDARLAMIRRALLAATAPHFIRSEGHPSHLATCLDWLERALGEL